MNRFRDGLQLATRRVTVVIVSASLRCLFALAWGFERNGDVTPTIGLINQLAASAAAADSLRRQIDNPGAPSANAPRVTGSQVRCIVLSITNPTFNENFTAVDGLELPEPLPSIEEAQAMAAKNNPELRAAIAAVQVARHEVQSAWAEHFPTLTLDVWYGIDSAHFATSSDGINNLGYSAAGTLNVPIFKIPRFSEWRSVFLWREPA